jgi:transcriptional regulator with XRE-family HTH domain
MKRKQTFQSLTAYVATRTASGETLQEIAADLGLSVGYLCDLKNRRQTPGFKLAKRLSDNYGIPLESFLERRAS